MSKIQSESKSQQLMIDIIQVQHMVELLFIKSQQTLSLKI